MTSTPVKKTSVFERLSQPKYISPKFENRQRKSSSNLPSKALNSKNESGKRTIDEKKYAEMVEELKKLKLDKEKSDAASDTSAKKLEKSVGVISSLKTENNELKGKISSLEADNNSLKEIIDNTKAMLVKANNEATESHSKSSKENNNLRSENNNLKSENNKLKKENDDLKADIEKLNEQHKVELDSLAAAEKINKQNSNTDSN